MVTLTEKRSSLGGNRSFNIPTPTAYQKPRFYNPDTASFTSLDSFEGNKHDPQSFHKYLYCHADPVNNIDPTGMFSAIGVGTSMSIGGMLRSMRMPTLAAGYDAAVSGIGSAARWATPQAIKLLRSMWIPTGWQQAVTSRLTAAWFAPTALQFAVRFGISYGQCLLTHEIVTANLRPIIPELQRIAESAKSFSGNLARCGSIIANGAMYISNNMEQQLSEGQGGLLRNSFFAAGFGATINGGLAISNTITMYSALEAIQELIGGVLSLVDPNIKSIEIRPDVSGILWSAVMTTLHPEDELRSLRVLLVEKDQNANEAFNNDLSHFIKDIENKYGEVVISR